MRKLPPWTLRPVITFLLIIVRRLRAVSEGSGLGWLFMRGLAAKGMARGLLFEPARREVILVERTTRRAASPGRSSNYCCSSQGTRERGSAGEAYRKS